MRWRAAARHEGMLDKGIAVQDIRFPLSPCVGRDGWEGISCRKNGTSCLQWRTNFVYSVGSCYTAIDSTDSAATSGRSKGQRERGYGAEMSRAECTARSAFLSAP